MLDLIIKNGECYINGNLEKKDIGISKKFTKRFNQYTKNKPQHIKATMWANDKLGTSITHTDTPYLFAIPFNNLGNAPKFGNPIISPTNSAFVPSKFIPSDFNNSSAFSLLIVLDASFKLCCSI